MTNQSICCDSALASSVLADTETYCWIDFSQGESVAESGSIIRHYFRTHFSLYIVPRGLNKETISFPPDQSKDAYIFCYRRQMHQDCECSSLSLSHTHTHTLHSHTQRLNAKKDKDRDRRKFFQ